MSLSKKQQIILILIAGVIVGSGGLFLYLLRAHTYLVDKPAACSPLPAHCRIRFSASVLVGY